MTLSGVWSFKVQSYVNFIIGLHWRLSYNDMQLVISPGAFCMNSNID